MVELTKENFETEVLQAKGKVFVDFHSEGCAPCKALFPFVHKCSEKFASEMKFASMDIGKARRVAISQQVLGVPVMAIYENGVKIDALVTDAITETSIEAMIKRHI